MGNGKDILANLLVSGNFHSSSCAMIIRSDLIDWKKEGFLNILHEDEEITPRLFLSSSSIYITNKVYYNYRKHRDGSIMSSSSIGKFFRSRWGYLVSLLSCQRLLLENLSDKRLRFALITRSRYLSRHAFIPVLGAVKKLFLKKGF